MPGEARAMAAAFATSASMSRPDAGRIWTVISRDTSDCQSTAAARTSMTAPVVSDARKVMMAMTATKARPAMVAFGTIGVSKRGSDPAGAGAGGSLACSSAAMDGSIVDMQPALVQHEPGGVVLIHQRDGIGGVDHRRPRLVDLDDQTQQAL